MRCEIITFVDGENGFIGLSEIKAAWLDTWRQLYGGCAELTFISGVRNLKVASTLRQISPALARIVQVRNPDYFFTDATGVDLGGVEITTHSPDGSNIEKRYPFIWAARHEGLTAFVATPYSKRRPGGATNKIPHRHARRNADILGHWHPATDPHVQQILPLEDLQDADAPLAPDVGAAIWTWADIGQHFAHLLAALRLSGSAKSQAIRALDESKQRLLSLTAACLRTTNDTEASTLIRSNRRWIQVYNARPESGHWERGEGQFDSIDGRLMFTLGQVEFTAPDDRPDSIEFWLPQLTSRHPWILEQQSRGYGSKRLKNILVTLSSDVRTKFADELDPEDWRLLTDNPSLLLERLDWPAGIYRMSDLVPADEVATIARRGLATVNRNEIARIASVLSDDGLWFSTHRAYAPDAAEALDLALSRLPAGARVLLPRIPAAITSRLAAANRVEVYAAEQCDRAHLRALRQIHRSLACPGV